jgi:signal transduction histidine kinase
MTAKEGDTGARDDAPSVTDQKLILDQQEANEQLILAMIRAQELTDAAEAAQMEAELLLEQQRKTEQELRVMGELRERLLSVVGHDLQSPLGAISMSIQILMRQNNTEEGARVLGLIKMTLQRMDRLIHQLFDFTRARLGMSLPITLQPADLRMLCQSAIEELRMISSVPLEEDYRGDTSGTWDAERLLEVLSNLIKNAVDHAAKGTPVLVKAYGQDDAVIVEVVNQGEPIPDALLPVLFIAFHQGMPGFQAKEGHLGLGLFIAHEIVRAHGGTLTAGSAAGKTTFTFRLPRTGKPADVHS